jgi:Flp pilus assembly protein TadG
MMAMKTRPITEGQLRIANCGLRIDSDNPKVGIRNPKSRRGVVAVEFAIVAPVLLAIVFGMVELSRMFEVQNLLDTAAREGARFAAMDRDGLLQDGQSSNDKLASDVKNYLASSGIPRDSVTVAVKDHEDPGADFNLDDSANDLKLFDVHVSVELSAVSHTSLGSGNGTLTGSITFRNGFATISE